MRLKSFSILFLALALALGFYHPAYARKKLVRSHAAPSAPYGAWVKPKLRADRHALLLVLGGMQYADSVAYTLTYNAGPVAQGIQSSHNPEDGNTQKELVFGTCSGNDCVYHGNLNDMKLEVAITLKSGKTVIWRYVINP